MLNKYIVKWAKACRDNNADFLIVSSSIAYGISGAVQTYVIYNNKKVPEKERTFMALQDCFEALFRGITFYFIAKNLKNWLKEFAKSSTYSPNGLNYDGYREGLATLGGILGQIFAFNILTPLIRNPVAAFMQNHFIKKDYSDEVDHFPILPASSLTKDYESLLDSPFDQIDSKVQQRPSSLAKPNQIPFRANLFKI